MYEVVSNKYGRKSEYHRRNPVTASEDLDFRDTRIVERTPTAASNKDAGFLEYVLTHLAGR